MDDGGEVLAGVVRQPVFFTEDPGNVIVQRFEQLVCGTAIAYLRDQHRYEVLRLKRHYVVSAEHDAAVRD